MKSSRSRLLAIVGTLAVTSVAGAPHASAMTGTGNQNPDLLVSVSLTSSGANPDEAAPGDLVTAAVSVVNATPRFQQVNVRWTLLTPVAPLPFSASATILLAPSQTLARQIQVPITASFPKGLYQLTLEAANASGVSSATAWLRIV